MRIDPVGPDTIAPPAAHYAHGVVVTEAGRWLHTSGVVPVAPDGSVPDGIAAQAVTVWENLHAILAAAGMGPENVVSVTTYVVAERLPELGAVMAERDRALGGRRVASTLVTVPALARSTWLVEIAVVAVA